MVTAGELYVLTATVMALVALGLAVPVLLAIAREGRERLQQGRPEPPVEGSDAEVVHCRHCGAENESGYAYCEACARAL